MLGKKKLTEVALPLDAINKASAPKVLFPMPYASSPAEPFPKTLQADALLNRADEYLYQAKRKGRNRVVSGPFAS